MLRASIRASTRTVRNARTAFRPRYNSSQAHSSSKPGSDRPWAIASAIITIPTLAYLIKPSSKKSAADHHAIEAVKEAPSQAADAALSVIPDSVKDTVGLSTSKVSDAAEAVEDKAKDLVGEDNVEKAKEYVGASSDKASKTAEKVEDKAKETVGEDNFVKVKDKAEDVVDQAKEKASDVADKVSEKTEDAKDKASEASEKSSSTADDLKEKASDAVDSAKNKASDVADKVSDKTSEVKEKSSDGADLAKNSVFSSEKAAKHVPAHMKLSPSDKNDTPDNKESSSSSSEEKDASGESVIKAQPGDKEKSDKQASTENQQIEGQKGLSNTETKHPLLGEMASKTGTGQAPAQKQEGTVDPSATEANR
ncbi:hypothetical protein SAICODRAFT_70149 [Saitoella complicata NRRL Y-17804]|uniref:uncharacterized protein n=1 Tax=Saitoella complicata (strain BCRC 22490 / CBS 7301 / JCM 7358 / NBRC 10748 / NRRL Y-17804) TaxID=698492 RepID=UPI000866CF4F|nr:uncharacterized protein SAICODRAFT_70149 [Saitoella complicata NRRL Y-17804]ODQ54428.1 hypothetical protein SAICODRAFT_70149 [Saitoella complicata NRRL Y-17804]